MDKLDQIIAHIESILRDGAEGSTVEILKELLMKMRNLRKEGFHPQTEAEKDHMFICSGGKHT